MLGMMAEMSNQDEKFKVSIGYMRPYPSEQKKQGGGLIRSEGSTSC